MRNVRFFLLMAAAMVVISSCKKEEPYVNMTITAHITQISMHGGTDGAVSLEIDGGKAPYSYKWSNGATTSSISNLAPNSMWVEVTDATNKTVRKNDVIIKDPGILKISYHATSDGTVKLTVTGEKLPYTFLWSNGSTTADQSGLTSGDYTVKITSVNGHFITDTIKVPYALTDIDGNVYKTVTIGTQTWMTENLRVSKTRYNTPANSVLYTADPSKTNLFGRYYHTSAVDSIAPIGWHIPSKEEWVLLLNKYNIVKYDEISTKYIEYYEGNTSPLMLGNSSNFNLVLSGYYDFKVFKYINNWSYFFYKSKKINTIKFIEVYLKITELYIDNDVDAYLYANIRCIKN